MAVKITIHRGTNQIGGTITEIATENTHIFIDFGAELSREEEKPADWEMVSMMKYALKAGKCDAILFTHIHGDHIGLLDRIPEIEKYGGRTIQLGMGVNAWQCYRNIHETLKNIPAKSNKDTVAKEKHERIVNILDRADLKKFKNRVSFKIGDITVTPVSVDHSASDSYMFIIDAEGKCIVHTGDFRTHGRLGKNFFVEGKGLPAVINGLEHKPDVLITEGTMLSRKEEKSDGETVVAGTEQELENEAKKLLKEHNCAFVLCSSTNVESLASFYNAMMTANNKEKKYKNRKFYVNSYAAKQLELYRNTLGQTNDKFKFDENIESFDKLTSELKPKISQMKEDGFVMLITNPTNYLRFIDDVKDENTLLIYSIWSGYLEEAYSEDKESYKELWDMFKDLPRKKLHTSGHAYPDDIKKMIDTVDPKEAVIPIHTEKGSEFKELVNSKEKLKLLSDGDSYVLGKGIVSSYQEIANYTLKKLNENPEWEERPDRYDKHYNDIINKQDYVRTICECFDTDPTVKYLSIAMVNNVNINENAWGIVEFQLRLTGVYVATVKVSPEKSLMKRISEIAESGELSDDDKNAVQGCAEIRFDEAGLKKVQECYLIDENGAKMVYIEKTKELFGKQEPVRWGSKAVGDWLCAIKKCKFKLTAEHPTETLLLRILDENKLNLQLCKLGGQFYQFKTPLGASKVYIDKTKLSYSGPSGGNIDIMAYTEDKTLCVIELKDEYKSTESPEKAIRQAIAYAAFIIRLIRSGVKKGQNWYNIFGIDGVDAAEEPITVNAVIAMPCPDWEKHTAFAGKELNVEKDIIRLHYMYFDITKQNELQGFKTSLFEQE